jgi:alkanesulfonate monooxygenase SsuD/methylene tetrahydromethanopterin reductase-like flavin-dependent oxidoreductase (luciferase family)
MWTENEVSFEGKYTRLLNAISFPKPMQNPHPPIWIGGKHLRILDIVAEMADGWNYWELEGNAGTTHQAPA